MLLSIQHMPDIQQHFLVLYYIFSTTQIGLFPIVAGVIESEETNTSPGCRFMAVIPFSLISSIQPLYRPITGFCASFQ
ncbi:Uncharacterised protein [Bacteroides xylanisolvens]|nr:Uncharacterised protein [Bacteroides xylanisolvens]